METVEAGGRRDAPVVVSVPHSGTWIPAEIEGRLAVPVAVAKRRRDDYAWEMARLALEHATVVWTNVARVVIDLNRSGTVAEIDLTATREPDADRLVRLYGEDGELLWRSPPGEPPLTRAQLEQRLGNYYEPYHAALQRALEAAGTPRLLVDMHSMTDASFDLVVGDHRGRSAGAAFCEHTVVPFFAGYGLRAGYAGPRPRDRRGRPLAEAAVRHSGGFIASRYGDPAAGARAIQIEISRPAAARRLEIMQVAFQAFFAGLPARLTGETDPTAKESTG